MPAANENVLHHDPAKGPLRPMPQPSLGLPRHLQTLWPLRWVVQDNLFLVLWVGVAVKLCRGSCTLR
eukprot:9267608-Lingulodinium_polyedra.AAC.1